MAKYHYSTNQREGKMVEDSYELFIGIVSGLIAAWLFSLIPYITTLMHKWQVKKLLGHDIEKGHAFYLSYATLTLRPDINNIYKYPYVAHNRDFNFSADAVTSSCELRACYYLFNFFESLGGCGPRLESANNSYGINDKSMISFGGFSNRESIKTFDDSNNIFQALTDFLHNPLAYSDKVDLRYDHGIILRITPKNYSTRVWVVCAGIDEWGTSGSAWFLANRWRELLKETGQDNYQAPFDSGKDFACIIRVEKGRDESASLVYVFNSLQHIDEFRESKCD